MASLEMKMLRDRMREMMKQGGMPQFGADINPVAMRAVIEEAQKRMPVMPGVTALPDTLGGVEAEKVVAENPRTDGVIFYIHGGGLICGNALTSRGYASLLASSTKLPVYTVSYRLAPEHQYPAAVDDCFEAYREIVGRHGDIPIILIGESGGGYLCLTTALRAMADGVQLPAAIIPYSPVTVAGDAIDRSANDGKDFTVTIEGLAQLMSMYCPNEDVDNPMISPLFADYKGFPPIFIVWDSDETLAPDSALLVEKALAAGVEVEYKAYDDCFHAFATAGIGTPESTEVLENTKAFIERHLRKGGK